MIMSYTIGVDFGTQSARAVVICARTGRILSEGEFSYSHYQGHLPDGTEIPEEMVLADPRQYANALVECVRAAVKNVDVSGIAGIAVDATSLTLVATDALGQPMCMHSRWASQPDAWIKLWKSHSAKAQAARIWSVARDTRHPMLSQSGGTISDEWAFPKMLETFDRSPELFREIDTFWDLCDWLTFLLCGNKTRSQGSMCNKFHYDGKAFPDKMFWDRVRPGFGTAVREKLDGRCVTWGQTAGLLLPEMAKAMGIPSGIPVAAGSLDGHIAMPFLGLSWDGDAMLTIGTSTVCAVLSNVTYPVKGICGSGSDAMIPGLNAFDSGQCSVGDTFQWFIENQVPEGYYRLARKERCSIHTLLSRLAFSRIPDIHDPVALDWWNGNRCTRGDLSLRGAIYGLSLSTKPEDIYRCLVESTAFGIKNILDNFEAQGVTIRRLRACGGIAQKNPWLMQCYADVLNLTIEVSPQPNAAAIGAAITATVGARIYPTLEEAMGVLSEKNYTCYTPRPFYTQIYTARYTHYRKMDVFFGEKFW